MIKRVNFTGRRKIPRDRVYIEVYDGNPRPFAATIDLDRIQLLPHAAVFLEATCAGSPAIQRYRFGEVGHIRPKDDCLLTGLEAENVFFTLKIVDHTDRFGRLVGIADSIRPQRGGKQTSAGKRGILGIEPKDLGQRVWELDFEGPQVILYVNSNVPGMMEQVRDPVFYAAAYPEVVRQVLQEAIDEDVDIEEDEDRWPHLWLRFGKSTHPAKQMPPKRDDPKDERSSWVAEVVKAFCDAHKFADAYRTAVLTSNGGES